MISSGIYQIRNIVTNDIYIGSTNNFSIRKRSHFNLLSKNRHFNHKLQLAYNSFHDKLVFEPILECIPELLYTAEQYYLDMLIPTYNVSTYANNPTRRGGTLSRQHIEKIRKSNTGKIRSLESRTKQSKSRTGLKYSEEGKRKLASSRINNPNHVATKPGLISPDGIVYNPIINVDKFCREHSLTKTKVYDLYSGNKSQHKGWTLYKEGA